jgi:hypothetical protein
VGRRCCRRKTTVLDARRCWMAATLPLSPGCRNCRNCRNCRTTVGPLSDHCRTTVGQHCRTTVGLLSDHCRLSRDRLTGRILVVCRTLSDCRTVGLSDCRTTVGSLSDHCRASPSAWDGSGKVCGSVQGLIVDDRCALKPPALQSPNNHDAIFQATLPKMHVLKDMASWLIGLSCADGFRECPRSDCG